MATQIQSILECVLFLLLMGSLSLFSQESLCPSVNECNCYNAWGETRADCSGNVTHVPGELPVNLTQLRISNGDDFTHLTSRNMSKYSDLNMAEFYLNGLVSIHEDAFDGLHELERLMLFDNLDLAALPERVFQPLTTLQSLDLTNNAFSTDVFKTFSYVTTLRDLELHDNPLNGDIPPTAFGSNSDLERVYMSNCMVTGISQNAFQNMHSLTVIYLDENDITELHPNAFSGLLKIQHIFLRSNNIQVLVADVFSEISSTLEIADISHNTITGIHENAFRNLQKLTTLYLNFNLLTDIPSTAIRQISHLDVINLSVNKFTTVPTNAFSDLAELNNIFLCYMETLMSIEIGAFDRIANLTSLALHGNPNLVHFTPEHLPDSEHQTLQVLSIFGNGFTSLAFELFEKKPVLQRVDLHGNPYHCDCNIRWMTEAYHEGYEWASHWGDEGQQSIRCHTPRHLLQFDVLSMRPGDFTCDKPAAHNESAPVITIHLYGSVTFVAHAYIGIPATAWSGPNGAWYVPIRPIPEVKNTSHDSMSIRPFEELIVTDDITVVNASLRLDNVDQSASGKYEMFASNHVDNISIVFELYVLPYEETTTTETVNTATSVHLNAILILWCFITLLKQGLKELLFV